MKKNIYVNNQKDNLPCQEAVQYSSNVELIRSEKFCIIRGAYPRHVRVQLNAGVKAGHLGRFKKDGLKPEIYYHPKYKVLVEEIQKYEALKLLKLMTERLPTNQQEKANKEINLSMADIETTINIYNAFSNDPINYL